MINRLRPSVTARGTLLGALLVLGACGDDPRIRRPNILLITLDTTRADHLGCYGSVRPTSPVLDRLATEATLFTRAFTVTSWTLPSHASLFTGKFPSAHGAQYDPEGPLDLTQGLVWGDPSWAGYRARPLAGGEVTLASILREEGYATAGIVAGPWTKKVFGLDLGFDHYDDRNITDLNGRSAQNLTAAALDFVDTHASEPFFLFLNYYDPHWPWTPAEDFVRRVLIPEDDLRSMSETEKNRLLYDAEIRYVDEHLGRLFEHLRELEIYEETWIVVTSDHGELLGDAYLGAPEGLWSHGESLSQAELHVPLIIKYPGASPRGRVDVPVQLVDILPTVLEGLDLPMPPDVQGGSLLDPDALRAVPHPIVAEVYPVQIANDGEEPDWRKTGDWRTILSGRYKYAWNSAGNHALIDLENDPSELHNLMESEPELAKRLELQLKEYLDGLPQPAALGEVGEVDAETARVLQAIGYVGEGEAVDSE